MTDPKEPWGDAGHARDALFDAIVIGTGFAGLHALHRLRSEGLNAIALEAGEGVGGTWYWNRYPGARCDVESLAYSYSFSPEIDAGWRWSERYATQQEIASYLVFVTDCLRLRPFIRFNSRVVSASYECADHSWKLETELGQRYHARFVIAATGPLSKPVLPDISGITNYKGELLHSARWPTIEPDFEGKTVGVIGTGSSGTQIIPLVAKHAKKLIVFQRTANFHCPARNRALTSEDYSYWNENCGRIRQQMQAVERVGGGDLLLSEEKNAPRLKKASSFSEAERRSIMEEFWRGGGGVASAPFGDVMTDQKVNDEVAEFLRGKIAEIVKDPAKVSILTPRGFPVGTKRTTIGTDYFETFNRENVELIDVTATPIERFTECGLVVAGAQLTLDMTICASGFDALTGALTAIDIRGKDGQSIKECWKNGPRTYLGITVAGFPNLFMTGGPGSPSVLSNVVMSNEFQVNYIADLIVYLRDRQLTRAEALVESQERWTATVNEAVNYSLFSKSNSWYVGANIPHKARVVLPFTGGYVAYCDACRADAASGYSGYRLS